MLLGLESIFPPPFFNQWDPTSPSSVLSARAHLVNKLREDGPFDGVLAVSDGAALAATVMINDASIQYRGHDGIDPTPVSQHFRFAILIGAFPPFDSTGQRRLDIRLAGRPQIHCPTIHVVGNFDPFKSLISLTEGLCDPDQTTVVRWDGKHDTPGWSERSVCRQVVSELKKALGMEAGELANGIRGAGQGDQWVNGTNGIHGMTYGGPNGLHDAMIANHA